MGEEVMEVRLIFEQFASMTSRLFSCLVTDWGFDLSDSDHARGEMWVDFRSRKHVVVQVFLDLLGGLDVLLRLERSFGRTISLNVADVVPPEVMSRIERSVREPPDMAILERTLSQLAMAIRDYGRDILVGDMNAWIVARERRVKRLASRES